MSAMGAGSCRTDFHACATAARRHIFTRRDFPCGDFAPDSRFSNVRKPGCGESKGSLVEARASHERSHCFALKKFSKIKFVHCNMIKIESANAANASDTKQKSESATKITTCQQK